MSTSQLGTTHGAATGGAPRKGTGAGAPSSRPAAAPQGAGLAADRAARRRDATLTSAVLAGVAVAVAALLATGTMGPFLEWAWERHANVLSWYIRPLFVLPLALFAYRRSASGITVTLVALATSIFWFPAPAQVDPTIAEFLAFEWEWLTSGWTSEKVLQAVLAPASLTALCLVFWRRSLVLGLVVINAMALGKMAWGVLEGDGTGWAMQVPAIVGLALCDGAVLGAVAVARRRRHATRHTAAGTTGGDLR